MNREEAIRRLSTLTDTQLRVLSEFCGRLDSITRGETLYGPMAERLYLAEGTVRAHMSNICIKLGIDYLHPVRQKLVFSDLYCPLLKEVDLPAPPPDPGKLGPLSKEDEKKIDELEKAIVSWEPSDVVSVKPNKWDILPPEPTPEPRRLPWFLLGVAVTALVVVSAVAFGVLQLGRGQQVQVVTATTSSEDTRAPEVERQEVTREVTVEVTSPSQPTTAPVAPAVEETSEPTIIVFTATPAPSPTPRPIEIALPFLDEFDGGARPEWEVISGDWRMTNGLLTTITRDQWSYQFVGDPMWRDYGIEVDFGSELMHPIAVAVRVQDLNNLVQFQLDLDDSYWMVRENGEWLELIEGDGTYWHTPSNRRGHLRIEVKGDFFSAYLDDELWLSISDSTFQSGLVGLGIYCDSDRRNCTTFDNFKVYELSG